MVKDVLISILVWTYLGCYCKFEEESKCLAEFPAEFLFGVASSAYQSEGAWNEDGKAIGGWDHFTHTKPEIIADRSNGDVSCDSYHKIEDDVALLKLLGVHIYRFSVSWSRILPTFNKVNLKGISYYDRLINLLLENNIQPMVTIFHFDLPKYLEDFGGFTNSEVIKYFVQFSRVVFNHFGDRVKLWSTFNEPKVYCTTAYGSYLFPPGINQSGVGDYLCGHNILKAHAKVYHIYNNEYKPTQKGKITLTLDVPCGEPASNSLEDVTAAERYMQFEVGWFAHPVFTENGDYPLVMKELIKKHSKAQGYPHSRLPSFTQEEVNYIRGTHDYFSLNHYIIDKIAHKNVESYETTSFKDDAEYNNFYDNNWVNTSISIFKVVPRAITNALVWVKQEYNNPEIYITESGYADEGEMVDSGRVSYFKDYLNAILEAICKHDVNVKSYVAWSFMDSFEWFNGYTLKFGLYHVNFSDPLRPRTLKSSGEYFKRLISTRTP